MALHAPCTSAAPCRVRARRSRFRWPAHPFLLTEAAGAAPARAVFMLGDSVMLGSKAAAEKELAGLGSHLRRSREPLDHRRRADRHEPAFRDPRHHRHPARDQRRRQPDDVREPGRRRDEGTRRRPLRRVADHPRSPDVLQERQRRPAPEGNPVPEHARRRLERRRERDARRHGERRPPPQQRPALPRWPSSCTARSKPSTRMRAGATPTPAPSAPSSASSGPDVSAR